MADVIVTSGVNLQNEVRYGERGDAQTFITDEPAELGGDGAGADPYTLLLAALGSCISMTLMLYARRKEWPLERVTVRLSQRRVHAQDCAGCETKSDGFVHRIERSVHLEGASLSPEQHARLQEIAHKCSVHKTLTSEIVIANSRE
ncbi:MAG TPA: OsmC family protein [Pyrinomonadaceae bacterium]|jgi:putative redox protein